MLYRIKHYDKSFDLMHDPLPDSVVIPFLDPVQRAREVLQGRTSTQIDALIQSLNPYLDEGGELLFDEGKLESSEQGITVSRVKALKSAAERMELTPLQAVPDVTWSDYFAALSLAYLVEHLYEINSPDTKRLLEMERPLTQRNITVKQQVERAASQLSEKVVDASEAAAYAEQLQNEVELFDKASKQIRHNQSSAGGRGRAKNYESLKQAIFEIYELKYRAYSNRRAALLIWRYELSEDQKAVFQTEDPEITIAKWIGGYLKNIRSRTR